MYGRSLSTKPTWIRDYFAQLPKIPGWLEAVDAWLLMSLVETVGDHPFLGKLKIGEIGTYWGKSAIILGATGQLTVCDIFGDTTDLSEANKQELEEENYKNSLDDFISTYLRFHSSLPDIRAVRSSIAFGPEDRGQYSVVHIDASHEAEEVTEAIRIVREDLLAPGGVAVLDDFNAASRLGVQEAIWFELFQSRMRGQPMHFVFATLRKAFVTWQPELCPITRDILRSWSERDPDIKLDFITGLSGGGTSPFMYQRGTCPWLETDTPTPPSLPRTETERLLLWLKGSDFSRSAAGDGAQEIGHK
jgi:predicted O-methyltransferase YrrM